MTRPLIGALLALILALGPAAAQNDPAHSAAARNKAVATFGSGCFWCTESDFDKVDGVLETVSGYMGGTTANPNYGQVSSGSTGHAEVVQITYDPAKVSYTKLLDVYWHNVDPFDAGGQFCDRGSQYRPVIFAHTPEQKRLAEASKAQTQTLLAKRNRGQIVVPVQDAKTFTAAEAYHQNFHKTNAARYVVYRIGCGRDARLRRIWGSLADK